MSHHDFENDEFIGQIADALCSHGLRHPAMVGLEAGRPFGFLGGQFLWMLQPVLGLMISRRTVAQMAELLEQPSAVDRLIKNLEAREA